MPLTEAVTLAVNDCIKETILDGVLNKNPGKLTNYKWEMNNDLDKKCRNEKFSPIKTGRNAENNGEIIAFCNFFPNDEHKYREKLGKNRITQKISPIIIDRGHSFFPSILAKFMKKLQRNFHLHLKVCLDIRIFLLHLDF